MENFEIRFLTFHLTLFINNSNKKVVKCLYSSHTTAFKILMRGSKILHLI